MKIRTLILTSAFLVTAAGVALAQSGQTGGSTERTGTKTPDSSMSSGTTSKDDAKSKDTMSKDTHGKATTTGAGVNPPKETMDKNTSPASPNAGEKQEK
jgi:hypothetical protein